MKNRIAILAESKDDVLLKRWANEGFDVTFHTATGDEKTFKNKLLAISDPLELGEKYAIIAFGKAAEACLEAALSPLPKLCALVVFYPPSIPSPTSSFEGTPLLQLHRAGSQPFAPKFRSHLYVGTDPGFAEHGNSNYDAISEEISWSRALALIRKGFGVDVDVEQMWEDHLAISLSTRNGPDTLSTFAADDPHVNYVPTGAGGFGSEELERFYDEIFYKTSPPSLELKLLSRTVGSDRLVDETYIAFTHTQEVSWLFPGVPATNKRVELVLAVIISFRGGKVHREHIYYDQASALAQIGLLPPDFRGIELPVLGAEAARKVAGEGDGPASNSLAPGWTTS
ncbi:MAG: hypothetical protein M1814_005606 [Vezdaea aestivalis]|nr:MAG: hypothetical protein M1814_005606 [Vezdaea aestivalis]